MNNLKRLPQLGRLAPESTAKFWQYDQRKVKYLEFACE
jgi:hypothetical protein